MNVIMESGLAAGFATPFIEIVIFFLILATALILWLGTSIRRSRQEREEQIARAESWYRELLLSRGVSASERELLDRMTEYIDDPREKYLLLQDHRLFNHVASQILEDQTVPVSQASISSLRMRLGFTGAPTGAAPRATVEIPTGAKILVGRHKQKPVPAEVIRHDASALHVRIGDEKTRFTAGRPVQIIFRNSAGIFTFASTAFSHRGDVLELSHSERGNHMQRRSHYRRNVHLPVTITPQEDPEASILSEFLELGGNGATVLNPEKRFAPGQEFILTFDLHDDADMALFARVIRTSREETLLHVRFINLPERERDQIYRYLFSGSGS